jgi:hypothetical protein
MPGYYSRNLQQILSFRMGKDPSMTTLRFSRFVLVSLVALLLCTMTLLMSSRAALAATGTQSDLTDISTGQKNGRVVIASNGGGRGDFRAEVTVNLHHLASNTTFHVTRAIDLTPDGILSDPPDLPWVEIGTITTSNGGAGEAHFVRTGTPAPRFDVMLKVIGADGTELDSSVMTVTVK